MCFFASCEIPGSRSIFVVGANQPYVSALLPYYFTKLSADKVPHVADVSRLQGVLDYRQLVDFRAV